MKIKNTLILLILFTVNLSFSSAQRAMYVDDFESILNSQTKQNELLAYACLNNLNTLLLYELYDIANANSGLLNSPLKAFIHKAKTQYGILKVGAIAENPNFFWNEIHPYNMSSSTSTTEKFDIYLTEFEYWNSSLVAGYYCNTYLQNYGCNTDGAFDFLKDLLVTMKALALVNPHPISVEVYLGNGGSITQAHCQDLIPLVDLVRLTGYTQYVQNIYSNTSNRLSLFGNNCTNATVPVSVIMSSEPNFLQPYLNNNSIVQAEQRYHSDYALNSSLTWKNNINIKNFTYFTYTKLQDQPNSIDVTLNHPNWIVLSNDCFLHDHGHDFDPFITPIPANTNLYLNLPNCYVGSTHVSIFDLNGNSVLTVDFDPVQNSNGHVEVIDISSLLPDLYIIQITDDVHNSISQQIMID